MFQNYLSDNIKIPKSVTLPPDWQFTSFASSSANSLHGVFRGSGQKGTSRTFLYDGTQNNVILSLQMSLIEFDAGDKYVPFVYTYKATQATSGLVTPSSNICIIPTLGESADFYVSDKVIIPKLQLEPNESQFVTVGYLSPDTSSGNITMALNCRLHLEDLHCFQPSK